MSDITYGGNECPEGAPRLRESITLPCGPTSSMFRPSIGHSTRCELLSSTRALPCGIFNPLCRRSIFQRIRTIYPTTDILFSLLLAAHRLIISAYSITYIRIYPYSRKKNTRGVDLCCSLGLHSYECPRTFDIIHTSTADQISESWTHLGAVHFGRNASFFAAFRRIDDKSRRTKHLNLYRRPPQKTLHSKGLAWRLTKSPCNLANCSSSFRYYSYQMIHRSPSVTCATTTPPYVYRRIPGRR